MVITFWCLLHGSMKRPGCAIACAPGAENSWKIGSDNEASGGIHRLVFMKLMNFLWYKWVWSKNTWIQYDLIIRNGDVIMIHDVDSPMKNLWSMDSWRRYIKTTKGWSTGVEMKHKVAAKPKLMSFDWRLEFFNFLYIKNSLEGF